MDVIEELSTAEYDARAAAEGIEAEINSRKHGSESPDLDYVENRLRSALEAVEEVNQS